MVILIFNARGFILIVYCVCTLCLFLGASFLQKRVVIDGIEVSLQIWDTAGDKDMYI